MTFVTHSRRWALLKTLKRKRQAFPRLDWCLIARASLAAPRTLSFPSIIPRATRGSAQCVREGVATPWFLVKDERAIAGSPESERLWRLRGLIDHSLTIELTED